MALYQKMKESIIDPIDGEYYAYEIVIGKFPNIIYKRIPITYEEMNCGKLLLPGIEQLFKKNAWNQIIKNVEILSN